MRRADDHRIQILREEFAVVLRREGNLEPLLNLLEQVLAETAHARQFHVAPRRQLRHVVERRPPPGPDDAYTHLSHLSSQSRSAEISSKPTTRFSSIDRYAAITARMVPRLSLPEFLGSRPSSTAHINSPIVAEKASGNHMRENLGSVHVSSPLR